MKDSELLDILSKKNGYVSGEFVSKSAGISRTAVWKSVRKLSEHGHIIGSSSSGYVLIHRDDSDVIPPGFRFSPKCSSTNDLAREGFLSGDEEGTVYFTDVQTEGRGRMGRSWTDQSGRSVLMSILLRPQVSPAAIMGLSLMAGLATCKSINRLYGIGCRIKWPNDIIWEKRKIGGILIESASSGEVMSYAVVGIGINLNNDTFPPDLTDKASSIHIATGRFFPRMELALAVTENLLEYYHGPGDYINEYRELCMTIGSQIMIEYPHGRTEALAEDVSEDGSLLIRLPDGRSERVFAGEVSVRGMGGYADNI